MELRVNFLLLLVLAAVSLASGFQYAAEFKCWTRREKVYYGLPGLNKSVEHIDDPVECLNKCKESDKCGAVDIDTATEPRCWYQASYDFVASVKHLERRDSVTNYLRSSACEKLVQGVDLSCWTVTPQHHIFRLKTVDKKTLRECLEECASRDNCSVVDWDVKTTPKCWLQVGPLDVKDYAKNLTSMLSVTNFILNRQCYELVKNLDLTFWLVSDSAKYAGEGLVKKDEPDVESCLERCRSNPKCKMFEYDTGSSPGSCWVQEKDFDIKRGLLEYKETTTNFFLRQDRFDKFQECLKSVEL